VEARYEIGGEYTKKSKLKAEFWGYFLQNHIDTNSNPLPKHVITNVRTEDIFFGMIFETIAKSKSS
jgi:hypothetical protein